MKLISLPNDKEMNVMLYQCPYNDATSCTLEMACLRCEHFARATPSQDTEAQRLRDWIKEIHNALQEAIAENDTECLED
jgi:hypothetical protein